MKTHYWEIANEDAVVIPSLSFDAHELKSVPGVVHYEERMLYVLLALAQPRTRIIFVTSIPLDKGIFDYYVSLLPKHVRKTAHERVQFMNVCNPEPEHCLSQKICNRPRFLRRIKNAIDPQNTVLHVSKSTEFEMKIAKELGIPMYSASPEDAFYGTKPGSRQMFKKLNIPCADGSFESRTDVYDLIDDIIETVERNPHAKKGVVKLSDGFSGKGNAIIDLTEIQLVSHNDTDELRRVTLKALQAMKFCCHGRSWKDFSAAMKTMGAIFEIYIDSEDKVVTSPSVQVVVNEDFTVSVLSTHEQVLDDQVYVGCIFPADEAYRKELIRYGREIGEYFAEMKVRDHFSVDFICTKKDNQWTMYAIEINLRVTGTTHPWMTMKLLTHGHTSEEDGLYYSNQKQTKYYYASDNIVHEGLHHLVSDDIREIFDEEKDVNWCPERQTGVVFHLLGCMSENGKVGMTSIANSSEEAQAQFQRAVELLQKGADESVPSNVTVLSPPQ